MGGALRRILLPQTLNCQIFRHKWGFDESPRRWETELDSLTSLVSYSDVMYSDDSGSQIRIRCGFVVRIVRYSDETDSAVAFT